MFAVGPRFGVAVRMRYPAPQRRQPFNAPEHSRGESPMHSRPERTGRPTTRCVARARGSGAILSWGRASAAVGAGPVAGTVAGAVVPVAPAPIAAWIAVP